MRVLASLFLATVICAVSTSLAVAANLTGNAVVLRALDKVTASTEDYTVTVGDSLQYGSLTIDVKHCEKRPPEDIPETYAFLQIFDLPSVKKTKKQPKPAVLTESVKIFSGWMLGSDPAASALDHRVYDIWVVDCKTESSLDDLRP